MTPELKQLLTEQVRPEVLQQVFDLIEGKKLTAESFKDMAIECDNDEQMAEIVRMAKGVGLDSLSIMGLNSGMKYFHRPSTETYYSNWSFFERHQTPIHYTDFINQYK